MPSSRAIKNRIKSTKNIQQITKAMQAVSAVKMRKSEGAALKGREFALYAVSILKRIEQNLKEDIKSLSPLFATKDAYKGKICLVVIASDKGLAGAFNSNVLKGANDFIKKSILPVDVIAIGKKAKEFFERNKTPIKASFEGAGDFVSLSEVKEITNAIINVFLNKEYDQVDVVYTNFVSALKQEVVHRPLLPLHEDTLDTVIKNIIPETGKYSEIKNESFKNEKEYKFEPDPKNIVKELVPVLVEIEVFHSILEANASEHAARMVAMKNASENAKEVIADLTIFYNKARQAQITKELIEITSGKEALAALEE